MVTLKPSKRSKPLQVDGLLRLPVERRDDAAWTNLRIHDVQERWDPTLAPWVTAEHSARMRHAVALIEDYAFPKARVIDVGCAQGTLGHLLAHRGYEVTLVDVRSSHIEYARDRCGTSCSVRYCVGHVPDVPAEEGFDVVICTEVIEHMPRASALLAGLKTKCRPGGILYLTTPNGSYFLSDLPTYSTVAEGVLANMEHDSDDGNDHRFGYTLDELLSVVRTAGFSIREAGVFLPFWVVGYAKTGVLHRLHLRTVGHPLVHHSRRGRQSFLSRAVATSIYLIAERYA